MEHKNKEKQVHTEGEDNQSSDLKLPSMELAPTSLNGE